MASAALRLAVLEAPRAQRRAGEAAEQLHHGAFVAAMAIAVTAALAWAGLLTFARASLISELQTISPNQAGKNPSIDK